MSVELSGVRPFTTALVHTTSAVYVFDYDKFIPC